MGSCQTVMVDWIMTLAFAEIKHFKIVKLTGFVKKAQKVKWESLLHRKRAGQAHEFDHVFYAWFEGEPRPHPDEIEATPTFIIDGEKVMNQPWDDMKQVIDAKLAEAGSQ